MNEAQNDISISITVDGVPLRIRLNAAYKNLYLEAGRWLNQQVENSKGYIPENEPERDIQALRLTALRFAAELINNQEVQRQNRDLLQRMEDLSARIDQDLAPSSIPPEIPQ